MASRNYAARMSCFSLISAIETDLRGLICDQLHDEGIELLPADVVKSAKDRYSDHHRSEFESSGDNLRSLLEFIDFYDLSKILNKIKTQQTFFSEDELFFVCGELERLSKCRNRVCHSRPLEPNDFNELLDFTRDIKSKGTGLNWANINEAIRNLDTPSFALKLNIPEFWKNNKRFVYNNLPIPEFDDTGFMGRDKDRNSINKLLLSNTKVISIVGEGGIGKTALAQRCLYDILELCEDKENDPPCFDIIIWTSLKTNRLTAAGAEEIRNSISSGSGLFQNISENLGTKPSAPISHILSDISEYMSEFKVLLCIDNLETISGSDVRDFLAEAPQGSKVLITTRVGLGEIEYRYKLDKLDDKPSIQLMRGMSRLLNVETLSTKKNDALSQLCKQLYNNPLLIKWYVLSVAAGQSPTDIVRREGDNFKAALRFCFENLYDRLSDVERTVISVIACMRKPVSAVELRFMLGESDEIEIEEALNQLHNSSMLESVIDRSDSRTFSLTGVASEYISELRPPSPEIYQLVRNRKKELKTILDQQMVIQNHHKYDPNAIYWSNVDERICATYLKKALSASRGADISTAEEHIKTAKKIMPGFSECYRISAQVLRDHSPFRAHSEFDTSIDLNPNSALTRYSYSQFLIKEEELPDAEEQINKALEIDPDEISFKTCKAWILTISGDYRGGASIYEEVLPLQKDRHRKFRLSTYDQASTCYMRYHDQMLRDGDFTSAKSHLKRAGEILSEAIGCNTYDNTIVHKMCRLLQKSEEYYRKSSDPSMCILMLSTIDLNASIMLGQPLQIVKDELKIYALSASTENQYKANEILGRLSGSNNRLGRTTGTVVRGRPDSSGRGLSFGFIKGDNSVEYFFHRTYLRPPNLLDEEHQDVRVHFVPGRNEKGLCAFDIELLKD